MADARPDPRSNRGPRSTGESPAQAEPKHLGTKIMEAVSSNLQTLEPMKNFSQVWRRPASCSAGEMCAGPRPWSIGSYWVMCTCETRVIFKLTWAQKSVNIMCYMWCTYRNFIKMGLKYHWCLLVQSSKNKTASFDSICSLNYVHNRQDIVYHLVISLRFHTRHTFVTCENAIWGKQITLPQ